MKFSDVMRYTVLNLKLHGLVADNDLGRTRVQSVAYFLSLAMSILSFSAIFLFASACHHNSGSPKMSVTSGLVTAILMATKVLGIHLLLEWKRKKVLGLSRALDDLCDLLEPKYNRRLKRLRLLFACLEMTNNLRLLVEILLLLIGLRVDSTLQSANVVCHFRLLDAEGVKKCAMAARIAMTTLLHASNLLFIGTNLVIVTLLDDLVSKNSDLVTLVERHRKICEVTRMCNQVYRELFMLLVSFNLVVVLFALRSMNLHLPECNVSFRHLATILYVLGFTVVMAVASGRTNSNIIKSLCLLRRQHQARLDSEMEVKCKCYISSVLLDPPAVTGLQLFTPSVNSFCQTSLVFVMYVLVLYRIQEVHARST